MERKINLRRTADELTTYAAQRQVDFEQNRMGSAFQQPADRNEWVRDILRGMAEVCGEDSAPLIQAFDQQLDAAHGCFAVEMLDQPGQKHLVGSLSRYAAALECREGDQRPHAANVLRLLEDMSSYLPWHPYDISLYPAREQIEAELVHMTAQMPIRFTRIVMGGDAGPHWASGYAPGAVTDAEGLRRTAVYQAAVQDFPGVKSWPAICTVYEGGGGRPGSEVIDATPFDLEIMKRVGDQFVEQRGVRWTCGFYQMTISAEPEEIQTERSQAEEENALLQGSRPLGPDDLEIFEFYSSEGDGLTFCLDVLTEEEIVFGRQLSNEQEGSYIMAYAVYDEATGQVSDTLDVELRMLHDEKWFYCRLSPEVREALKQKMDSFCVALYGEHLDGMLAQSHDDEPNQSQTDLTL